MQNEQISNNEDIEPVSQLLREMNRVEAPANFDLGVRGRIAAGNLRKRGLHLTALAGYSIPLAMLLIVGGYFGFNSFYLTASSSVPAIVDTDPTLNAPQMQLPSADLAAASPVGGTPPDRLIEKKSDNPGNSFEIPGKKISTPREKNTGGGSVDQASGIPRRLVQRTNLNGLIQAKDALTQIGVMGVYSESGWRVESAVVNSVADRSGVRTGDVIEALNEQPFNEKTTFKGKFTGKSLRVQRDGKSLDIILKN
ncbi:MAG: hypothetical protein ACKVQJ_02020 [Pyrinomonadaceae bacterium]